MQEKPIISPYLVLASGILAVSTASIFIRFAQDEVSSIVVAGYRMTVSAVILLPILFLRHRQTIRNLNRNDLVLGLLLLMDQIVGVHNRYQFSCPGHDNTSLGCPGCTCDDQRTDHKTDRLWNGTIFDRHLNDWLFGCMLTE